jgi:hypothetical protein
VRFGTALVLLLAACVAAACGHRDERSGERACGRAVLADWSDGRIDRQHRANCYLAAIDVLPEDLRAYTSAEEDIVRALQASSAGRSRLAPQQEAGTRQLAATPEPLDGTSGSTLDDVPPALMLVGSVAVVLGVAALGAFAARRLR